MDQRRDFYKRLQRTSQEPRLQSEGAGPAQTRSLQRNLRLKEIVERHQSEGVHGRGLSLTGLRQPHKITQSLSYILAFAMGAMAVMIARFLRFQITGDPSQITGDMDLALDVLFAIVVAFLLREAVSLSAVKRMGAQVAGILLAVVTMHNVVHQMPDVFSRLFSSQWVAHVTETTEPGTLYFRGHSYSI